MSNSSNHGLSLPPEQEAIRAKSFHPSGTFVEFPKEDVEKSIPERFEKVVTRFPDHLAIKSEDQTLTYSQVNSAANRVAHAILSRCGRRQRPVALFLERGAPLIIA